MPSAAALVSRWRKSRSLCSKEVFFVKLCKSGGLLLPSLRSLVIPWPILNNHEWEVNASMKCVHETMHHRKPACTRCGTVLLIDGNLQKLDCSCQLGLRLHGLARLWVGCARWRREALTVFSVLASRVRKMVLRLRRPSRYRTATRTVTVINLPRSLSSLKESWVNQRIFLSGANVPPGSWRAESENLWPTQSLFGWKWKRMQTKTRTPVPVPVWNLSLSLAELRLASSENFNLLGSPTLFLNTGLFFLVEKCDVSYACLARKWTILPRAAKTWGDLLRQSCDTSTQSFVQIIMAVSEWNLLRSLMSTAYRGMNCE